MSKPIQIYPDSYSYLSLLLRKTKQNYRQFTNMCNGTIQVILDKSLHFLWKFEKL